ncbi:MAG: DUF4280 domain-containing protein [Holosporales bacterium]|nr:DUF4280 domain-containing protein [Holosporales bacterium]
MSLPVVQGALCCCSMGLAPTSLNFLPASCVFCAGPPVGTVMDAVPFLNVLPFGLCMSLANPITAAATTAALGVLTPTPCTLALIPPWIPGNPRALVGACPALTNDSRLFCSFGGVISIAFSGQVTVLA